MVMASTTQTKRFDRSHHRSVGITSENKISVPPIVGVPAFFVRLGTVGADGFTDLQAAQAIDEPRTQDQADQERRQDGQDGPRRDVAHQVQPAQGVMDMQGIKEVVKHGLARPAVLRIGRACRGSSGAAG